MVNGNLKPSPFIGGNIVLNTKFVNNTLVVYWEKFRSFPFDVGIIFKHIIQGCMPSTFLEAPWFSITGMLLQRCSLTLLDPLFYKSPFSATNNKWFVFNGIQLSLYVVASVPLAATNLMSLLLNSSNSSRIFGLTHAGNSIGGAHANIGNHHF